MSHVFFWSLLRCCWRNIGSACKGRAICRGFAGAQPAARRRRGKASKRRHLAGCVLVSRLLQRLLKADITQQAGLRAQPLRHVCGCAIEQTARHGARQAVAVVKLLCARLGDGLDTCCELQDSKHTIRRKPRKGMHPAHLWRVVEPYGASRDMAAVVQRSERQLANVLCGENA